MPEMLERGHGRIVMVSSVTGPLVTAPGSTGYATKRPDEVAVAVAFPCSDQASYMTGQSIAVDGGNIIQEPHGIDLYGGA